MTLSIAVTGHRPKSLGPNGYSEDTFRRLKMLASDYLKIHLASEGVSTVITGMAIGWDQATCLAALELGIPVTAAIPFDGQCSTWPEAAKDRYYRLLGQCSETIVVSRGGYEGWKLIKRNHWMVNHARRVVALYDGSPTGGTANAVAYAKRCNKPVDNLWGAWCEQTRSQSPVGRSSGEPAPAG